MTASSRARASSAQECPPSPGTPKETSAPSPTADASSSRGTPSRSGETEETTNPWYADGLRFSCRQCGRCCKGPGGFVWLTEAEADRIAASLNLSTAVFGKRFLRRVCGALALVDGASGDCPFLDPKRGCRIYAVRPAQCKTYPWWPEVVEDEAAWTDAGRDCPGIGRGTRHPLPTIEQGLRIHAEEQDSPFRPGAAD